MGATKSAESRDLLDSFSSDGGEGSALPTRSELLPGSALFPKNLLQLKDTPRKLYALGEVRTLSLPAIAIVGARKATAYGLECAERFARKAAYWGVAVVSGGAIGCDMAAHQGALRAGGNTIVVLGSGADVVYPLRARSLFKEVLEAGGTLVSEAPWGSAPLTWAFSKRNRIIAALAGATLIVEAGLPSGTFQTADHTLALGNEVLVVPGPIFSNTSKGSNRLLAQGAVPIVDDESFEDALTQLFGPRLSRACNVQANAAAVSRREPAECEHQGRGGIGGDDGGCCGGDVVGGSSSKAATLSPQEIVLRQLTERLCTDLSANPMTVDNLAAAYQKDVVEIIRVVSKLEVSGELERLRDGRYMTRIR
ncbi:MAG: DNA-processing protein DprA [Coriobacteriales bacterium]|jgi:DNA protecting protein DprA|nr:DNA-processing protein DprA [Coriobacteriales bacterium]